MGTLRKLMIPAPPVANEYRRLHGSPLRSRFALAASLAFLIVAVLAAPLRSFGGALFAVAVFVAILDGVRLSEAGGEERSGVLGRPAYWEWVLFGLNDHVDPDEKRCFHALIALGIVYIVAMFAQLP